MFEKRELIRWFKKGWAYILATTAIGILVNFLGISSLTAMIDQVISNPSAITGLIAFGLLSLAWAIVIFPMVAGWLIEFIDRKIRK